MEGEAGDIVLEVDGAELAVLHDGAVIIEDEAAAFQMPAGALDVVAGDGEMAVLAAEGNLHHFESVVYKDGVLVSAETRGNGYVGSDITEHVKQFKNVPLKINKEGTYIIDGIVKEPLGGAHYDYDEKNYIYENPEYRKMFGDVDYNKIEDNVVEAWRKDNEQKVREEIARKILSGELGVSFYCSDSDAWEAPYSQIEKIYKV